MQDFEDYWKKKAQCLSDIREALPRYADRLNECDERLMQYIEDAISNNGSHCNFYEALGIRKELRLMDSYDMDIPRVQRTLRAIEGKWQNGRHVKGGLKFSTPRGSQHVRLMPFQAWLIFEIYAYKVDVSMEREYHEGDQLLPTEWVKDGIVWDTRRLTQEAHWFVTRKSGKTELGAAVDFVEACFLGDVNGQVLICAPSAELSKISFKAVRSFAMQIDPTCTNRMGGKYFRVTKNEMNWQPGHKMMGEIKTMAAGKVPKDGYYASVVHADEHGQPSYVNGHCDMQASVDTCWGSTGPRREKLLMHTTTAGRVKDGPYKSKIENDVEPSLLREMQYPLGQRIRTSDDYWCAFLLQLDKWELTDDLTKLDDPELFKKVNRSIGTTVQPTYYRERLHEAATGTEDTKQEVLTKDFNMWQQGRITTWMKGDRIRPLQIARRITDCKMVEGWQKVYCGLDFSHGDDLFAMTFLAVNYKAQTSSDIFFADTIAWVLEDVMKDSPNLPLYEQWIEQGWLRKAPGEVFDSIYAINELAAIVEQGINIVSFGYDPAQSIQPINQLKAWLQTLFQKRKDVSAAEIAKTIQKMVVPVPQTMMVQNPRILEIEEMIKRNDPFISFSESPLWPWCFGNCAVEVNDSTNLRRITKGGPAPSHKIDPIHALMDAVYLFDLDEGRVEQ